MSLHALTDAADRAELAAAPATAGVSVTVYHDIEDVAVVWDSLARDAVSPGQSRAFVRAWITALNIPQRDQYFVLAQRDGVPLALLPLWRRRVKGVRVLGWFPGAHVGCNAPLVDSCRLALMDGESRRQLWSRLLSRLSGADLVHLKAVPGSPELGGTLFAELGTSIETETLYRAHFASWDEANTTQRSKSRRKHDRQQGERLEALGTIDFEEVGNGPAAVAMLDTLFAQRAARFRAMGIADPFVHCNVRAFYDALAADGSGVDVRLHALRLNGGIVAMRYNIALGETLYCLISSMSDGETIQSGSPGKQCLLRVMQTVFDAGHRVFDMGAGFTDEKRHWCNEQLPLREHYVPLTPVGALAAAAHRGTMQLKRRIKDDPRLMDIVKAVRARVGSAKAPRGELG